MMIENLAKRIELAFEQEPQFLAQITDATEHYGMLDAIYRGVAVGFSGGPDSVLLLIFLSFLQKKRNFPLAAVHVNHMIREGTAARDEEFSREFCSALGIRFAAYSVNVPEYSSEKKLSIEDAARRKRYEVFGAFCKENPDIATIATAHNATDNLETILFRMMRGTGAKGLLGISPVRDNVIRPLINLPKAQIIEFLNRHNIPYVLDETNDSCEYTRNYVRHEILPKLTRLNPVPENAAIRIIENLRDDVEYIELTAKRFIDENEKDGGVDAKALSAQHPSVISHVILQMASDADAASPEAIHVAKIRELLSVEEDFDVSLPGKRIFSRRADKCFIKSEGEEAKKSEQFKAVLREGFNEIPELNIGIAITDSKFEDFSSNVYKISIQANLGSAIINNVLFVRRREEGDAYFYGGITRKVKKLFIDKKIPLEKRSEIPILCDDSGIVWIPGFGVRSDRQKNDACEQKWVTIYQKQ